MNVIAMIFNNSHTAKWIFSFKKPEHIIEKYKFNVTFVLQLNDLEMMHDENYFTDSVATTIDPIPRNSAKKDKRKINSHRQAEAGHVFRTYSTIRTEGYLYKRQGDSSDPIGESPICDDMFSVLFDDLMNDNLTDYSSDTKPQANLEELLKCTKTVARFKATFDENKSPPFKSFIFSKSFIEENVIDDLMSIVGFMQPPKDKNIEVDVASVVESKDNNIEADVASVGESTLKRRYYTGEINVQSYKSLKPGVWLNDVIINSWINW